MSRFWFHTTAFAGGNSYCKNSGSSLVPIFIGKQNQSTVFETVVVEFLGRDLVPIPQKVSDE